MFLTWSIGFWLFLMMMNLIINSTNKNKQKFRWKKYWKLNLEIGGLVYFSYVALEIARYLINSIIVYVVSK